MSDIKLLAELIRYNPKNIFFTGAGISTESGIPDYRSPESGLWNRVASSKLVEIDGFTANPRLFYEVFSETLFTPFNEANPNIAHEYISKLEQIGHTLGVITQNIDGLHIKADSKKVYELHGTMETSSCITCVASYKTSGIFEKFIMDGKTPECACGGTVKPDIVFFGESLPEDTLQRAFELSAACSLFIVAGSSLSVVPANMMPKYAKDNGAKLVIINKAETPLDYIADIVINKRVGEVFTELDRLWKKPE